MASSLVILCVLIAASSFVSADRVVYGDGRRLAAAGGAIRQKRQTLEPSKVTGTYKEELLESHLKIRETAAANAGNMLTMTYSESLASLAQITADTCEFKNANLYHDDVGDVGQVIYRTSGSVPGAPLEALANDGSTAYNFDTNTCEAGTDCPDYKQIVWYNTDKVGCGKQFCPLLFMPDNTTSFSQWFWVCNYQEIAGDERPYLESDKPCSLCQLDPGTICERNQCTTCDPATNVACRTANSTLCVEDKDTCCSSYDSTVFCDPASDRFEYMKENCGAVCGIYLCGQ